MEAFYAGMRIFFICTRSRAGKCRVLSVQIQSETVDFHGRESLAISSESKKNGGIYMERLTRRSPSGKALLNRAMFPEYAEETLNREVSAFGPFSQVLERLCEFEDSGAEQ